MIEIKSLLEYYLSIRKSYKDMWCQFGMNIALLIISAQALDGFGVCSVTESSNFCHLS